MGKCLYGEVPQYLQGIFQRVDSVHNHGTRRAEAGLFVPRANSTAAKNMFGYEGGNGLPMVLKSADNFIDFKRNCNSHFKIIYDLSQIAKLHWPNDGSNWLHLALACQQWTNEVYWLASHTGLPMSCHRVAS